MFTIDNRSIKVVTIVGLIILGIVLDLGGGNRVVSQDVPTNSYSKVDLPMIALGSDIGSTLAPSSNSMVLVALRANFLGGGRS